MAAQMRVLGIDFTSAPSRTKTLTCAVASFDGVSLEFIEVVRWSSFTGVEAALLTPGPWIAAMDFPFGQSRRLVENMGWPLSWSGYVKHVARMTKSEFRTALIDYKALRPAGDKQHKRACDVLARSQSPQTLFFTPVGLMFYEGAPRLLNAKVHLPPLHDGDTKRVVLEGYPGIAARSLIGATGYKSDAPAKQTTDQLVARKQILSSLLAGRCEEVYGFRLRAPMSLTDDPTGDDLDAMLCAIQAAWGWRFRKQRFGAPVEIDRLEGWICDPALGSAAAGMA